MFPKVVLHGIIKKITNIYQTGQYQLDSCMPRISYAPHAAQRHPSHFTDKEPRYKKINRIAMITANKERAGI